MKKTGEKTGAHHMREMRIEMHHSTHPKTGARTLTGYTVHHHMLPTNASKSGAFMEEMHHSFPFGADQHEAMMDHVHEHSAPSGDSKAMAHAGKAEHDVEAVDDGREEE